MTKPNDPPYISSAVITTPTHEFIQALKFAKVSEATVVGITDKVRQDEITSFLTTIHTLVDPQELKEVRNTLSHIRPAEGEVALTALPSKPPSNRSPV